MSTVATAFTAGMIYQQLINGLMLGASYSLVAIGYTLIFGVLNLLYFAHGEIFMVGAFVGLFLVVYAGPGIYGALLGAMVACAALGVLSVFVAIRPVPKDRPLAPLISTIGLTIVLQNLAVYFIGGQQLAFPETIRQTLYHVGPVTVSSTQLFILGVAVSLMLLLWLFIEHSKIGRAIRAVAENHETAALLGVDVNKRRHHHLHHRLGHCGRRRRARRAEELEHLAVHGARRGREGTDRDAARRARQRAGRDGRRPDARHDRDPFGRLYRHHRARPVLVPDPDPHPVVPADRSVRHAHRRAKVAIFAMFDGLIDGYTQSILIFTGISVIAAYSFFAPFKTGQVSLGQAGFMAVGAYAAAVMTQKFGHSVRGRASRWPGCSPAWSASCSAFRRCASRASTCCC